MKYIGKELRHEEFTWHAKSGGATKGAFCKEARHCCFTGKPEILLEPEGVYNRGHKPYRFKGVKKTETGGLVPLVNPKMYGSWTW